MHAVPATERGSFRAQADQFKGRKHDFTASKPYSDFKEAKRGVCEVEKWGDVLKENEMWWFNIGRREIAQMFLSKEML